MWTRGVGCHVGSCLPDPALLWGRGKDPAISAFLDNLYLF